MTPIHGLTDHLQGIIESTDPRMRSKKRPVGKPRLPSTGHVSVRRMQMLTLRRLMILVVRVGMLVIAVAVGSTAKGQSPESPLPPKAERPPEPAAAKHFETKVRPLLVMRCIKCHGPKEQNAKLRLDSAEKLFQGGESGSVVVPGDLDKSRMIQRIRDRGDLQMPPETRLKKSEIAVLEQWVKQGAVWPEYKGSKTIKRQSESGFPPFSDAQKSYWAFQPIEDVVPPKVEEKSWPTSPVDRFVLAKIAEKGLTPSPPAERRALIRRVTFDLIGLPPTPQEIDAFLKDASLQAYEKVVDQLLKSPHYGERWGRHWLDVVRYADTTANDGNFVMRYAYRYRDYVVSAFNRDLPYDQFIIEQLAGDLLPADDDIRVTTRRAIATGFLMLGPKALAEADKEQVKMDIVDEQIDVTGRTFLGLTLACARCHNHKFDPIPTEDYYSLAGIFRSLEMLNGNVGVTSMWQEWDLDQQTAEQKRQLVELRTRKSELEVSIKQRQSHPAPGQAEWEKTVQNEKASELAYRLPASVADNLMLWLDADDINADGGKSQPKNGQPASVWKDKSGKGNDVSSLSKPNDPSFMVGVIGRRPVVRFAGNGLQTLRKENPQALPGGDSSRSMFVVTIPQNEKHNGEFLVSISQVVGWGNPSKPNCWNLFQFVNGKTYFAFHSNDFNKGTETFARGKAAIFEMQHVQSTGRDSTTSIWKNGKFDGSFVPKPVVTTDSGKALVIGSNFFQTGTEHHRSVNDVAEVIVYNRSLTSAERSQVGRYLARKYDLETGYASPISIVRIPQKKRTKTQQTVLRQYYLEHHDADYKKLRNDLSETRDRFAALEKANSSIRIMAPKEGTPRDLRIHLRGNRFNLGKVVPRRFLQIIAGENHAPFKTKQSGRLDLARWIANPDNPLTARVMVNRIWQGHFGVGLVATSDNFGSLGGKPSHPKLLDWLAKRFIESGWSIKAIHRLIVLSSTYRQSSSIADFRSQIAKPKKDNPKSEIRNPKSIDPDNRLLWRMNRRRLEAEALRDAILAITGRLDRTVGGNGKSSAELFNKGDTVDKKLGLVSAANFNFEYAGYQVPRRSLYLPVIRNALPEMLSVFDVADANAVTAKRNETTVATQSLFMLNNAFVRDQSMVLAKQLLGDASVSDEQRFQRIYVKVLGRESTTGEITEAISYLRKYQTRAKAIGRKEADARLAAWQSYCQILFCLNEFLYVD